MTVITNQISYLAFLYRNYMYDDIVEYATVTLQLALEKGRYDEALLCYEYLAGAYHDLGRNQAFSDIMVDYEKICLSHGGRRSKMNFYVWLSRMHLVAQNHQPAIEAGQKAIAYGHYFKNYRVVCINLGNLAWQYTALGNFEQARVCARLGQYYSDKHLADEPDATMRMNIGILFYLANAVKHVSFAELKRDTLALMVGEDTFYHGQLALFEGILLARMEQTKQAAKMLSYALNIFETQNNIEYGYITLRYIEANHMTAHVSKYATCLALIGEQARQGQLASYSTKLATSDLMQPYHKQYFANIVSPILFATHQQMSPIYLDYTESNRPLFCIAWHFNTSDILTTYGVRYERQHCHRLLNELIQIVEAQPIRVTTTDFNQGIILANFENFSRVETMLIVIEAHFSSLALYNDQTSGVSIHFGVTTNAANSPYEKAVVRAEDLMYYAKTKKQLYMK